MMTASAQSNDKPNGRRRFEGRHVLITGAGGLLGSILTDAFAAEGARLSVVDRDRAKLDRLEARYASSDMALYSIDLSDPQEIARLIEGLAVDRELPDVIVNNAGILPFGDIFSTSVEDWDAVMALNLRAPFLIMRDLGRAMIDGGRQGCFINISSGAAAILRTDYVPYGTSKAGLEWMSAGFALALGRCGIRVNCVRPGLAVSDDLSVLPTGHVESASARNPMGRILAPQDLSEAVLFLASDAASYITGQTLGVNGGSTLPVWTL